MRVAMLPGVPEQLKSEKQEQRKACGVVSTQRGYQGILTMKVDGNT